MVTENKNNRKRQLALCCKVTRYDYKLIFSIRHSGDAFLFLYTPLITASLTSDCSPSTYASLTPSSCSGFRYFYRFLLDNTYFSSKKNDTIVFPPFMVAPKWAIKKNEQPKKLETKWNVCRKRNVFQDKPLLSNIHAFWEGPKALLLRIANGFFPQKKTHNLLRTQIMFCNVLYHEHLSAWILPLNLYPLHCVVPSTLTLKWSLYFIACHSEGHGIDPCCSISSLHFSVCTW